MFPSATPTAQTTTVDPVQENLALIIGVPTGIGLSIIGLLACIAWLSCSSYLEYRRNRPAASGTHSTNLPTRSKGAVLPAHNMSSVVSEQGDSIVMSDYSGVARGGGGERRDEVQTNP